MKKTGTFFNKERTNFEKTLNAKDREIVQLKKESEKLTSEKIKVKEESLRMVNKERTKYEKILKEKNRELDELKIEIKVLRSEKKEKVEFYKRVNMERRGFEKLISEIDELKRENEKLKSEKMVKIDKNETMVELNKKVENNDEIMEKGKAKEEQINGVVKEKLSKDSELKANEKLSRFKDDMAHVEGEKNNTRKILDEVMEKGKAREEQINGVMEEKLLKESELETSEKLNNIVNRLKDVMAPVEIGKNNVEMALNEVKRNHVAFEELRKKIEDLGEEFRKFKSEHEKLIKKKELENRNGKGIFKKTRKKRAYAKKWNRYLLGRAIKDVLETENDIDEKINCKQEKLIKKKELENRNGKGILQEDILEPEKGEHTQENGIDFNSEEPSRICWSLKVEPLKNGEGSKDHKALVKDVKKKKKKRF